MIRTYCEICDAEPAVLDVLIDSIFPAQGPTPMCVGCFIEHPDEITVISVKRRGAQASDVARAVLSHEYYSFTEANQAERFLASLGYATQSRPVDVRDPESAYRVSLLVTEILSSIDPDRSLLDKPYEQWGEALRTRAYFSQCGVPVRIVTLGEHEYRLEEYVDITHAESFTDHNEARAACRRARINHVECTVTGKIGDWQVETREEITTNTWLKALWLGEYETMRQAKQAQDRIFSTCYTRIESTHDGFKLVEVDPDSPGTPKGLQDEEKIDENAGREEDADEDRVNRHVIQFMQSRGQSVANPVMVVVSHIQCWNPERVWTDKLGTRLNLTAGRVILVEESYETVTRRITNALSVLRVS